MDIRNWPIDVILQLPDHCFGRRFSVSCNVRSIAGVTAWDISEMGLPETCVLWEVSVTAAQYGLSQIFDYIRLALGDQLPANAGMMDALEPLIPGLGVQLPEPRNIEGFAGPTLFHMRQPIQAMGRRLVLEATAAGTNTGSVLVVCEFSSIPREVPDCLLSGNLRSP